MAHAYGHTSHICFNIIAKATLCLPYFTTLQHFTLNLIVLSLLHFLIHNNMHPTNLVDWYLSKAEAIQTHRTFQIYLAETKKR